MIIEWNSIRSRSDIKRNLTHYYSSKSPLLFNDIVPNIDRLLRPDIVYFHFPSLGTETFLRQLTLSNTLSSNAKSSRSVDPQFSRKLLF